MGEWREIKRSWHDTTLTNCALCGRLVPRRVWFAEVGGALLPFCDQECEALYRAYWLPKYGRSWSTLNDETGQADAKPAI